MQFRIGIFFSLVAALTLVAPSAALACSTDADPSVQVANSCKTDCTCCPAQTDNTPAPCSDHSTDNHCHCPGCGNHAAGGYVGGLTTDAAISLPSNASDEQLRKQAFYFSRHLPEEVYLPIWQPPQLAA
jgi:hypothetical protein